MYVYKAVYLKGLSFQVVLCHLHIHTQASFQDLQLSSFPKGAQAVHKSVQLVHSWK